SSRRRHTRFSRDWSSDVCSSDLLDIAQGVPFQLSGGDLDEIFQPGNFTASGITVAQAFDEGLPPGSYDICFRVYVQGRVNWTPRSEERRVGEEQGWTRSREDKG